MLTLERIRLWVEGGCYAVDARFDGHEPPMPSSAVRHRSRKGADEYAADLFQHLTRYGVDAWNGQKIVVEVTDLRIGEVVYKRIET